jgi:hypothetical protein
MDPNPCNFGFRRAVQRLRAATVQYVVEHWEWPLGGVRGNATGEQAGAVSRDTHDLRIVREARRPRHLTYGHETTDSAKR